MIPKRYSEVVIRRRIDNTMAKKGPKGQTIKTKKEKELSTKHYIEKLNIEQHESNSNRFSGKN